MIPITNTDKPSRSFTDTNIRLMYFTDTNMAYQYNTDMTLVTDITVSVLVNIGNNIGISATLVSWEINTMVGGEIITIVSWANEHSS